LTAGDRQARRTFLKRTAQLGGLALGAEGLLGACKALSPSDEANAKVRGMYSQRSVNVCYSPMKVTSSERLALERGKRGVYLRKGPAFFAEAVVGHDGDEVLLIPEGRYGRQSARRAATGGCQAPALRPDVNGWVWGYDLKTRKSGWLPTTVAGHRYSKADPEYGTSGQTRGYLFGPNDKDFDCRFPKASQAANRNGYNCDSGAGIGELHPSGEVLNRVADFGSRVNNNQEDFYLRLALGSVAFQWLGPGDLVAELYHRPGLSYGKYTVEWSFIEVRRSAFTPRGTRGWMLQSGLRPA
jgi:hypothetical protein